MRRKDLRKIYKDSIKLRRIKLDKWERALEGVAFRKPDDKQRDYSIKQKYRN